MFLPGPEEKKYLFIDGGYINAELKRLSTKYFDGDSIQLEYGHLSQGYVKTFYYDCLPHRKQGEDDISYANRKKDAEQCFDNIRRSPGSHVILGKTTGKHGHPRQKQVDVRIAVDMLSHAYNKNMFGCTLLTGDQDFKPLVEALLLSGAYVSIWCFPKSVSNELLMTADARMFLSLYDIIEYASTEFRNKYGSPQNSEGTSKFDPGMTSIRSGTLLDGRDIELCKLQNGQLSVSVLDPERKKYRRLSTRNEGFLLTLAEERYGKINWHDSVITEV